MVSWPLIFISITSLYQRLYFALESLALLFMYKCGWPKSMMSFFTNILGYCIVLPKGLVLFICSLLTFLCHFGWDPPSPFRSLDKTSLTISVLVLTLFFTSKHFVGDCLWLFQLHFYIWACFWSCRIAKSAVIFVSFRLPFYHLPLMYLPSCYLLHCNMP
jgi:hypothetical protein